MMIFEIDFCPKLSQNRFAFKIVFPNQLSQKIMKIFKPFFFVSIFLGKSLKHVFKYSKILGDLLNNRPINKNNIFIFMNIKKL